MIHSVQTKFSNLGEILSHRAAIQPDKHIYTFLKDGESEQANYSFKELEQRSKAIAATLQQLVQPGDRALLLFQPGIEFITAFYGCLLAGVVAVPAYPPNTSRIRTSIPRLMAIVKDSGATISLTTSDILPAFQPFSQEIPELGSMIWQTTDSITADRSRYWMEEMIKKDDLAFLQYTSGSTGAPKGVMVSHGNILYNEEMIRTAMGMTEGRNFVGWLPLYHDMGLIANMIQPLYSGCSGIIMSPISFLKRPIRWLKAIQKYNAGCAGGPNFAYDLCVNRVTEEEKASLDLSNWEIAFNGAEPVRADTLRRFSKAFASAGFRSKAFYPCYGLAEATLMVTGPKKMQGLQSLRVEKKALENDLVVIKEDAKDTWELVSCGAPQLDQEVVIADPVAKVELADREIGEIWVKGENVAQGYFQNAEKTEETFHAHLDGGEGPFMRTGDLGFLHQGQLYITGRIKDLIKVRGRGIYPQDIEKTVEGLASDFPELRFNGCAAFSIQGESNEEIVLIAEVAPRRNPNYDAQALVNQILATLNSEMEISLRSLVLIKTSIPKTSSGKKMRHACRKTYLKNFETGDMKVIHRWDLEAGSAGEKVTSKAVAPSSVPSQTTGIDFSQDELIKMLREWIAEDSKIDMEKVFPDTPFSEFGMDSLSVVTLVDYLERRLGKTLNQEIVFEYKTIYDLSEYLKSI